MNSTVKALTDILEDIGLSHEEGTLFMKVSLFPGLTPQQLQFQCGFSRMTTYRIIERLESQGYLFFKKAANESKRKVFAIPLDQLSQRLTSISEKLLERASEIQLLHKLAKVHKSEHDFSVQVFSAKDAMEEFFKLHSLDWNTNLAIGTIEPFLESVGLETMKKWPKERARRGRKAQAVITQLGPLTREMAKTNEEDLRAVHLAKNISMPNQHVELIPELNLTSIFTYLEKEKTWTLTKINSAPVTNSYSSLVKSFFK